MVSKYNDLIEFFEGLAISNKILNHNAAIAGTDRLRKTFISVDDEDALGAAIATGIDFPCMVMVDLRGRMVDKQQDFRKMWYHTLFFLDKINTIETSESIAKNTAIVNSELVMNQFMNKLYQIIQTQDPLYQFRDIYLGNFVFSRTGRVADCCYGWKLSFGTETDSSDITNYDDTAWQ